jgi:tetratricopeptide (TPR) repeat protein
VAYAALLLERRRALHGVVLAAIERHAGTGRSEQAEARAYHAVRAEIWDRAVDALREAGTAAFGRGAITASIERIEQAIELLPRLPGSADNTRRGIDVRLSCTPLLARGQHARFGALVREAEQLARDLDDQRRLAQALRLLGGALMADGEYTRAAEYEEEVLGLSTALGDAEVRIAAGYMLGQILGALGRYREGIARLVPLVDGPDAEVATSMLGWSTQPYAASCAWLGWFHAAIGKFHLARRYREWADSLLLAGELPDAQRAADTALSLARAMGERGAEAETLRVLGAIAAAGCSADPGASATLYQQGLALAVELGMRPSAAHCHLGLGTLYRRAGDQAKASEHLSTATTMYREMGMGFWLAQAETEGAGGHP